jgi:hypothetical protein
LRFQDLRFEKGTGEAVEALTRSATKSDDLKPGRLGEASLPSEFNDDRQLLGWRVACFDAGSHIAIALARAGGSADQ